MPANVNSGISKTVDVHQPPGGTNILGAAVRVKRNPVSNSPITAVRPYAPANNLMAQPPANNLMNANKAMLNQPMTHKNNPNAYKMAASSEQVPNRYPLSEGDINSLAKIAALDPSFDKAAGITNLIRRGWTALRGAGTAAKTAPAATGATIGNAATTAGQAAETVAKPTLLGKAWNEGMNVMRDAGIGYGLDWGTQLATGEDSPGFAPAAIAAGIAGRTLGRFVPASVRNFVGSNWQKARNLGDKAVLPMMIGTGQEIFTGQDYISNPIKAMRNQQAAQMQHLANQMGYATPEEMMQNLQRMNNSPFAKLLAMTGSVPEPAAPPISQ